MTTAEIESLLERADKSNVIVLVDRNDKNGVPVLYGCPKCRRLHSPAIYAVRDEVAHEAALDAAINCYECRNENACSDCGDPVAKPWTKCSSCRRQAALAKAVVIPASDLNECFGFEGDFYSSPEDAADAGEPWVFAAEPLRHFHIDPDYLLQSVLDDHFEDASVHDLVGADDLLAAVAKFNEAQTSGSFEPDRNRVALLHQASDKGMIDG